MFRISTIGREGGRKGGYFAQNVKDVSQREANISSSCGFETGTLPGVNYA